jgi:GAF domain-containing protein
MKNHFNKDIIPANDQQRLEALWRLKLTELIPEGYFKKLAHIMARTFNTPIGLVSLVKEHSVEFIGNYGMEDTKEVSRGISLCSLAILDDAPTVFEDAVNEPCLLANPLVTGEFGLRFYAGAPIIMSDGFALGTACIVGKETRTFDKSDQELLQYFAGIVVHEIEQRIEMLT